MLLNSTLRDDTALLIDQEEMIFNLFITLFAEKQRRDIVTQV